MMESRTSNAKKNIIWGFVNKIVTMLLPFVNRTLLIYVLGAQYLGLSSLFTSILQMLNIAEMGFSSAVVFSMYRPIAEGDGDTICALLAFYRKAYRIIGLVVFGVGIAIIPLLPLMVHEEIPGDLNLLTLYFIYLVNTSLGYWLFSYKKALISAHQKERVLSSINSLIKILETVLQVFVVVVFKSYYAYILILPVMTLCENLAVEFLSKKYFPQYVCRGILDRAITKDIGKRIRGLLIQKICSTSRNSMDNIIISVFVGLEMVSVYGNYYVIMSGVHGLLGIITSSITAGVGDGIVRDSVEQNYKNLCKFDFMYMWLGGWCSICLLCLYQPLMKIWMGESLMLPASVAAAIAVYMFVLCFGDVRSAYTAATGLWWEGRWRALLEAVMNIVLNIVLGKFFGIMGIVVATILSIVIVNFLYGSTIVFKYYFKNGKLKEYYFKFLSYAVFTAVAAVLTYGICSIFHFGDFGTLLYRAGVCLVVPNVVFLLGYCRKAEFRQAKEFLAGLFKNRQR